MGTILTTVFVAAPLAFMAGWLLSKALFMHTLSTRRHGSPVELAEENQSSPTHPDSTMVKRLHNQLEISRADSEAASHQADQLKDALAERDHQLAELRRKLQLGQMQLPPECTEGMPNLQTRKALLALQEQVDSYASEADTLKHQLLKAEGRLHQSKHRFKRWWSKARPLLKQFRQQRLIISELREEMRQREHAREQEARRLIEKQRIAAPPIPPAVVPQQNTLAPTAAAPELRDDLEELRGIGPALHRKLNNKGIYRLQQLADLNPDELIKVCQSVGVSLKQVRKYDWSSQASAKLSPTAPAAVNT